MSAARKSGSSLVVGLVAGTVGAIGLGCVYLPFVADRESLRGLNENDDRVMKKQYEQYLKEIKEEKKAQAEMAALSANGRASNSMWGAMKGGNAKDAEN